MTPREAAQLGKSLEPYDLFWLEDCTPGEDQDALRYVRAQTTTPLAIGEVFNTVYDFQTLITERLIDYVRAAVTHAGGITHLKKIADFAAIYGIKTGFHGPTDVSPVGQAAHLHLDLALHNFGIQEYMRHSDETLAGVPHLAAFRGRAVASWRPDGPRRGARQRSRRRAPLRARVPAREPADWTAPFTTGEAPTLALVRARGRVRGQGRWLVVGGPVSSGASRSVRLRVRSVPRLSSGIVASAMRNVRIAEPAANHSPWRAPYS